MVYAMTNKELILKLKQSVANEKSLTLEVIKLLSELDRRRYYLELGFSSLFDFATRDLCYEEGAAVRRIQAARLLTEIPEIEVKIASGELGLSSISQAVSFFRKSKTEDKRHVLEKLSYKSARQTAKILADLHPELAQPEKLRELGNDKIELKITITEELHQKLNALKSELSHINPSMNYAELLEILVDKVNKQPVPKKSPPTERVTKSIPAEVKRQVFQRDNGKCTYPNCHSKHLLQYDHIKPKTFEGQHSIDNLRLLCFNHHKLITEKTFGKRTY
jgi:hypothetical protein